MEAHQHKGRSEREHKNKSGTPDAMSVAKGTGHCGAGCTFGDICAEWLAFFFPALPIWFGWQALFSEKMFAIWVLDYVFAFVIGIAFPYFTITPMRGLGVRDGILQALKADAISLTAWQVAMYGLMAIAQFVLFRRLLGVSLAVNTPSSGS